MLLSQKGNFKFEPHLQSEGSENNAILLESLNGGIDLKSQGSLYLQILKIKLILEIINLLQ